MAFIPDEPFEDLELADAAARVPHGARPSPRRRSLRHAPRRVEPSRSKTSYPITPEESEALSGGGGRRVRP